MAKLKQKQTKKIKINGVKFTISRLTPAMFLDKDYLLPISSAAELADKKDMSDKELEKTIKDFQDIVKDTILKSTDRVKIWFKEYDITDVIDDIMENVALFTRLYNEILYFSLGQKKKITLNL